MKITANLEHAALTPSGKGIENFKVYPSRRVQHMWCLRLYPQPQAGLAHIVEIWMDHVTALNLGIISGEQYESGE